jgi:hypothetical protein
LYQQVTDARNADLEAAIAKAAAALNLELTASQVGVAEVVDAVAVDLPYGKLKAIIFKPGSWGIAWPHK